MLRRVDVLFELLDARIPLSSRNPLIDELLQNRGKPRIVLLNKRDLADPACVDRWIVWFRRSHPFVLPLTANRSGGGDTLLGSARQAIAASGRKVRDRPIKAMVLGIPNVGKSTLLNTLSGHSKVEVRNTPGVTRMVQPSRVRDRLTVIDTPGVLWPRFEDPDVGVRLAILGAIADRILPLIEVGSSACELFRELYPEALSSRYHLDPALAGSGEEYLSAIGRNHGCLTRGGSVDLVRATTILLKDIRSGRLGRICLEHPPNE